MNKYKTIILATCLLSLPSLALADLVIGAGVGVANSPYKDYDTEVAGFPIINYEINRFYIDTYKAGINLLNDESTKIDFHVGYLPLSFKTSKTDNLALKTLDKRKSTMFGGIGFSRKFNQKRTEVTANVDFDMLNNSDSTLVDLGIKHHFSVLNDLMVSPFAGILWASKKHNNYYYGISLAESMRSGLNYYNAEDSIHPYIGVSLYYKLTDQLSFITSARADFLPSEVKNSPMVDSSTLSGVAVGLTYHFK